MRLMLSMRTVGNAPPRNLNGRRRCPQRPATIAAAWGQAALSERINVRQPVVFATKWRNELNPSLYSAQCRDCGANEQQKKVGRHWRPTFLSS